MKKPLNYFGYAFDNPEKGYNKAFLKTKEGKKEIKKSKKYNKKLQKQIKERGFDDSECWNLFYSVSEYTLPRLKHFKKIQQGFPGSLSEKEWNKILDKMIYSFEKIIKEEVISNNDKVDEGLKLFSKYFLNLWD